MIFPESEFRFIQRGFKDTLVLIPGWATDYRIFERIDLPYNYLLAVKFDCFKFKRQLRDELNKRYMDKISLFGYSLGGFLACEFAREHPAMVEELILVSMRKCYDAQTLQGVESRLIKNKRAYLREFYAACFSAADKESFRWFKEHLLKDYIAGMELEGLARGLDYLRKARIGPGLFTGLRKIRIFHGEKDSIAPFQEAVKIKLNFPQADFISLSSAGHLLFLKKEFKDNFQRP